MLATIAVGGFPAYCHDVCAGRASLVASATELVVAFVMGLADPSNMPLHGLMDIRLAGIILAVPSAFSWVRSEQPMQAVR
jgi:hypothetical protein